MGILSDEEWCSKSEARQRHTPGEECRRLETHPERCVAVLDKEEEWGGDVNHLYRTVLPGLCLPLTHYLVSLFMPDWPMDPPQDARATFCWDGSHCSGLWVHVHTYYGVGSPPFSTPKNIPSHVQAGKSSLTSGVSTLSLCFSRAQLLTLALSLECLVENKGLVLLHLTTTGCPAQRPIVSYLSRTSNLKSDWLLQTCQPSQLY